MEPIEYLILTNLRDALQAIRADDGYHYDVRGIAVKLDPNQDVETLAGPDGPDVTRPFIVIEVLPEQRVYRPSLIVEITRPVTVHWVSETQPTRDEDRLHTFLKGVADVERAIVVDIQRGGYALDTRLVRSTFDLGVDGSQVWAIIELVIREQTRQYGLPNVTP